MKITIEKLPGGAIRVLLTATRRNEGRPRMLKGVTQETLAAELSKAVREMSAPKQLAFPEA